MDSLRTLDGMRRLNTDSMYDAVDDWLSLNDGSFVGGVEVALINCFQFPHQDIQFEVK